MNVESEFEYPSTEFFDKILKMSKTLPLIPFEAAKMNIERFGSGSIVQSLSGLMTRLKIEVVRDHASHNAEKEGSPYFATLELSIESEGAFSYLAIRTVLNSKYAKTGRIKYGSTIMRVGNDIFLSEDRYGD